MIRRALAVSALCLATSAFAAPAIRGVVMHAGKPVAGATISPKPLGLPATTDASGAFVLTPAEWPQTIDVARKGLGSKRIDVPRLHADANLGTIELARAATLRVRVVRNAEAGVIDVRLGLRGEQQPQWLSVKRLQPRESIATFGDLDAASYLVLLEGDEPLKRQTSGATVRAGESRTIDVQPIAGLATLRFTSEGRPLGRAEVTLAREWSTKLVTDADGEHRGIAWERGEFDVSVRSASISAPFAGFLKIEEGAFPKATFEVPDRRVRGRVIDGKGRPIASTRVTLRTSWNARSVTRKATTDANGAFAFDALQPGAGTLMAFPPGHLRPGAVRFTMADADKRKEIDIVAEDEFPRTVTVVDSHGQPRAKATVICASGMSVKSTGTTDERGVVTLGTPLSTESHLYVIPSEGGFAVKRVSAMDDDRLRIIVAPPTASLEVATLATSGEAIPEVALLMSVNGEVVPPEVARELHVHQGIELVTDERGIATLPRIAPGIYGFWPYRGDDEAEAVMAAASAMAAPVSVNVRTGGNRATVKFRKRR